MKSKKSIWFIVCISIAVGMLHFLIGPAYQGPLRLFLTGYLIDILLPMNIFLLVQLPLRRHFPVKSSRILAALGTLALGVTVEYLQFLGLDFLGSTFDPWDFFMYALGVGLGQGLDMVVLDRWESGSGASPPSDGKLQ